MEKDEMYDNFTYREKQKRMWKKSFKSIKELRGHIDVFLQAIIEMVGDTGAPIPDGDDGDGKA